MQNFLLCDKKKGAMGETFLFLFFGFFVLFSAFMVIKSKNPVYSVLFLILVFCNSASHFLCFVRAVSFFFLLGYFLSKLLILTLVPAESATTPHENDVFSDDDAAFPAVARSWWDRENFKYNQPSQFNRTMHTYWSSEWPVAEHHTLVISHSDAVVIINQRHRRTGWWHYKYFAVDNPKNENIWQSQSIFSVSTRWRK